ncbi:DUF2173 family protein [Persephonella sp.]
MNIQELINKSQIIFAIDRETGKVIFSIESIPADLKRLIDSLGKMNFKITQIEAEGWNMISNKYIFRPLHIAGIASSKYALLQDDTTTVIIKTPEKLKTFFNNVRNRPLEDLVLGKFIEVAGVISVCGEEYDIKGDLNEEEIKLLNSIIHANDSIAGLTGEMLSLISGMIWYPLKGWFMSGKEHAIVSIFGKWVIINSKIFEEILIEGD